MDYKGLTARRRLLLGGGFEALVLASRPYLWVRARESVGAVAFDSSGNGRHGTIAGTTSLAQAGLLGGGEAWLADGLTSVATFTGIAPFNAGAFSLLWVVNAAGAGENGGARVADWVTGIFYHALNSWQLLLPFTGGNGVWRYLNQAVPTGWMGGICTWDGVDTPGGGACLAGASSLDAITEIVAPVGDYNPAGTTVRLLNNSSIARTFDGLFDEFILWDRALASAEYTPILKAMGVLK